MCYAKVGHVNDRLPFSAFAAKALAMFCFILSAFWRWRSMNARNFVLSLMSWRYSSSSFFSGGCVVNILLSRV